MKWSIVYLVVLLLCPTLRAATVTIQGAQTNQVIDGFGVNINYRSWSGTELQPVLDAFIDQAGMTLFRVVYELSDWEATNDNSDVNSINWTYYNAVYSSTEFTRLWGMLAYLNGRGITNGAFLNFMGWGPSWMMAKDGLTLKSGMEAEWAEMIASALAYARNIRGLQFNLVAPNNEPDIYSEGIHMDVSPYVTALHELALKLDANGLGDVRFIGPDRAGGGTDYMPEMMADAVVMAKLKHFGVHSYSAAGGGSAGVRSFLLGSAYPDRTFWMTEFNVWCSGCDNGTPGTYDWSYTRGTADYLLNHLLNGASGGQVWEGYDSIYAHHGYAWSCWGLFGVDDINAPVKTYTPRKHFYTLTQITKWVRPGAQRINITGTTSPFSPLLAFKHAGSGQITLVGINTSSSAATLNGTLASLPAVPHLDLYYTSATTNLASGGIVPVSNGTFNATIPANCVFTLTGFLGINVGLTQPISGARFNAPAIIPMAASATAAGGSIAQVEFYNGETKLGEATNAPYELTWENVPMGDYSLAARATDAIGNVGTSAVVNVAVVGSLSRIDITPAIAVVMPGGAQQFSALGGDSLGHALDPQPEFTWALSGGGTVTGDGLFTAGGSTGGPFEVSASSGAIVGTGAVSIVPVTGGTIGNTNEGTLTDNLWYNGAWINASRFQASSNLLLTTIKAKVTAVTGTYKCAIYTDSNGLPSRLIRDTAEVGNPGSGWQTFGLTSPLVLTNGQYCWLAIWSDDANAKVYYSNNSGTLRWGQYNYASWPDPINTTGGGTYNYCIYATGTTTPGVLISILVTPANPSILTGSSQQFTATGIYSDGSTSNLTSQVTWASSNTAVAIINSAGLATATFSGTTMISGTLGGVSGNSTLTVLSAPTLVSIAVTPVNPVIITGDSQQFAATGTYSDSSIQDLTDQVIWTSSIPEAAEVNDTGLATALSVGTTTISATLGEVSGSSTLTVESPPLEITTASLPDGTANTAYAAMLTADGGIAPYGWSLASGLLPNGLTLIPSSGAILGTPRASGTFDFVVRVSDAGSPVQSATQSLSILVIASLVTIEVTPKDPSIPDEGSQQFTATGTYSDASVEDLTDQVTWTSALPGVADINESGLATALSAGTTAISAAIGQVSGSSTLTVQPPLLEIVTVSLPDATANLEYSTMVEADGGTAPYAWALVSGSIPDGLTLDSTNGVIDGLPTVSGTFSFDLQVSDSGSPVQSVIQPFSIVVNSAPAYGIIGNINEGTSSDNIWDDGASINAGRFLAGDDMTVSAMRAKVTAIAGRYKCAIYSDNDGQPDALLGSTIEKTNSPAGWETFPLSSSLVLTNGQYYWLAIWSDDANARVFFSDNMGTLRWEKHDYGPWPDPLITNGGSNFKYCIYAYGTGGPIATDLVVEVAEDTMTNLTLLGSDEAGPVTFAIGYGPTNGVLGELNTNSGAVSYTPNLNYNGGDHFSFTVNGGSLLATGWVSLTVTAVNDAPVAHDDQYDSGQAAVLEIPAPGVLTNDTDADGDSMTAILVSAPLQGSLILGAEGGLSYTPTNHFNGSDSFTYQVSDGQTNSSPATVNIAVSNLIQISSVGLSNNLVTVTWTSIAGKRYRLQYKNQWSDADWLDLPPDVLAEGVTAMTTNAFDGNTQRFYRVRCLVD